MVITFFDARRSDGRLLLRSSGSDRRQPPGHGPFSARHSGPAACRLLRPGHRSLHALSPNTRPRRARPGQRDPQREDGAVVRHAPSDRRQPAGIGGVQPLHRGPGCRQGSRCENRTGQMAPCVDPVRGLHAEPRHSHARSGTSGPTQPGRRPGHHQRLRSLFTTVPFRRRGLPPLPSQRGARRRDRAVRATAKGVALVAAALCGALTTVALQGSPSQAAPSPPATATATVRLTNLHDHTAERQERSVPAPVPAAGEPAHPGPPRGCLAPGTIIRPGRCSFQVDDEQDDAVSRQLCRHSDHSGSGVDRRSRRVATSRRTSFPR